MDYHFCSVVQGVLSVHESNPGPRGHVCWHSPTSMRLSRIMSVALLCRNEDFEAAFIERAFSLTNNHDSQVPRRDNSEGASVLKQDCILKIKYQATKLYYSSP